VTAATTDANTIREEFARQVRTIVPRFAPRREERFQWQRDREIAGPLRNFDAVFEAEVEVPGGFYGGGLEYASTVQINVSYPVSEADLPRFMGSDAQDIAAILIRLHTSIPGMFPIGVRGELPISEQSFTGEPGAYVGTFTTRINFFVADTVTTEAVA